MHQKLLQVEEHIQTISLGSFNDAVDRRRGRSTLSTVSKQPVLAACDESEYSVALKAPVR